MLGLETAPSRSPARPFIVDLPFFEALLSIRVLLGLFGIFVALRVSNRLPNAIFLTFRHESLRITDVSVRELEKLIVCRVPLSTTARDVGLDFGSRKVIAIASDVTLRVSPRKKTICTAR
jgi:hypothetical protein